MELGKLLSGINLKKTAADLSMNITGICYDSRKLNPGDIFVAIKGFESDGHKYIPSAVEKGAACVVCEKAPDIDVPYVIVAEARKALAVMSSNFFGNPSAGMTVIGVTGTNGKTTVTTLIKSLLEKTIGAKVGLIGTNKNMIGNKEMPSERTTPESFELQKLLRQMADEKCSYVAMEVSSHSLFLDRVYGVKFDIGVFMNLTEDHLDFHETMDNYAAAKSMLFERCGTSILNLDDKYFEIMKRACKGKIYRFSVGDDSADLSAREVKLKADGVDFCALTTGQLGRVHLGIPGMFSVYNALAALAVAQNMGISIQEAAAAIKESEGVKGRAEVVPTGRDFTVLIDYAHTPDALENILATVNGFKKGRSILLFGCGGDREKEKRPIMGKIAAEMADYVIVTSDNPRTEDGEEIIREILSGIEDSKVPVKVIPDRKEAIGYALKKAKSEDIVILAGKGHETYQIIGKEKHHFDEREIVAEFLA